MYVYEGESWQVEATDKLQGGEREREQSLEEEKNRVHFHVAESTAKKMSSGKRGL